MKAITETAMKFFECCETGQGWNACRAYCHDNAPFEAQALSLESYRTVEDYSNLIPHMLEVLPDAHYKVRCVATSEEQSVVIVYARFTGTHSGIDGPVPATGQTMNSDYAFVMRVEGNKVARVTKIWNDFYSNLQLGWQ